MVMYERRLRGVHPDLAAVVRLAATRADFAVVEGLRSLDRQRQLVAAGASQTLDSRHLTGHAVDLAPVVGGQIRWDWPLYPKLAAVIGQAAVDLDIFVEWGGAWKTFKDGPHFQLPRSNYPDAPPPVVARPQAA